MDGQPAAKPQDYSKDQSKDHSESQSWTSDLKDSAKKLFDEAYENPRTTAMVAAGAVAVGIGIYATKGRSLFAEKPLLLVEDTPFFGRAMKSALEEKGHKVTWIAGVQRPTPFTAIMPEGGTQVIDPRKYKAAFVDGELNGSYLQGEHVVSALRKDGVPSIGTSTIPGINTTMRENGAIVAATKPSIYADMLSPNFSLKESLTKPGAAQARLDELARVLGTPEGAAQRRAADKMLKKHL